MRPNGIGLCPYKLPTIFTALASDKKPYLGWDAFFYLLLKQKSRCVCVYVCVGIPFIPGVRLLVDVPAAVTQEKGHTGFLIHLPSSVLALIFTARRIQPFLSLVDREVEFCVLTN